MNNGEKIMVIFMTIALCFQRLSMAAGSIGWGIAIAAFLYLLYKSYKDESLKERVGNYIAYYKILGLVFICCIPSVIFSVDINESVKNIFELWVYRTIPFFMVTLFIDKKEILLKVILALLASISIDCLVALAQVLLGYSSRGWGLGGHSLNLASILSVVMPMLTVVILDNAFDVRWKKICTAAMLCCVVGVLAGKSRGAWVSLAVVIPLASAWYVLNSKKILFMSLIICLAIATFFGTQKVFYNRLASTTNITTDTSNADRIRIWKSCINMAKDYPIVGVGLGNFKKVYDEQGYRLPETKQDLVHSHNNFMQLWVESGLIGVLSFLVLTMYILLANFMDWMKTKDPYSLMIWTGWLGFTIFGMIDVIVYHAAVTKIWWFLLGTLLVLREKMVR